MKILGLGWPELLVILVVVLMIVGVVKAIKVCLGKNKQINKNNRRWKQKEIDKYWKLFKDGAITYEEYKTKKDELSSSN